eukprot:1209465-Rhodomonas_salina.1
MAQSLFMALPSREHKCLHKERHDASINDATASINSTSASKNSTAASINSTHASTNGGRARKRPAALARGSRALCALEREARERGGRE